MKVRKTNKSTQVKLTFGERSNARVKQVFSKIKASYKKGKQITKGIYSQGRSSEDVRKLVIKIKGGFAKSTVRRKAKEGIPADEYYYYTFPTEIDQAYYPSTVIEEVNKAIDSFLDLQPTKTSGSGPVNAEPRIREITIDYIYMK